MKAQLLVFFSLVTMGYAAQAQTTTTTATETAKPTMTKEEKGVQKAKQEAEMADALKGAGLSEAQIKSVHEALDASGKASSELKASTTLTDEQKTEAKKKITEEKNAKLKEIMGAEAYRKYNAIRKEQRAKTEAGN